MNLRLNRQILLTNQLKKTLLQSQSHLQYCTFFLDELKKQHKTIKEHFLFEKNSHFRGWESKLKQLTVSTLTNDEAQTNFSS